jgi:hypothetical protein
MRAALCICAGALCVALGWFAGRSTAKNESRQPQVRAPSVVCASELSLEALRDQVARIARAANDPPPTAAVNAQVVEKAPPVEEPSAESLAAHDQAMQLVHRAVDAAVWTKSDAESFRGLVPQMNSEQHQEALRALIVELNAGRLQVEEGTHPF